jgi:hypothetical protein
MNGTTRTGENGSSSAFRADMLAPGHDAAWDELLLRSPFARAIVPTWEVLAGWTNHRVGLFRGDHLVAGLVLSVQEVPLAPIALSRINCLMVDGPEAAPMTEALLAFVERFARRRRLIETELRLRLPTRGEVGGTGVARALRPLLERWGYRPLTKTDTSYYVPLDRDDEALLNGFERSARNKIRKAQRAGVEVVESRDYALLDDFYESYLDMCRRKRAPVQPEALVGQGLRPLIERGHATLFVERYPDGVANLVVVDTLGTPCYVLGTRSKANVRGQVPGAAQALHYEAMKALRDRGHRFYDLGGCEGPVPIEGHPNFGVWRFKYGFGGEFVRFLPYMRKVRGPFEGVLHLAHVLRGDFV